MMKPIDKLLDEVEALTKVYVGKKAESESWFETCERLERIDKLVKSVRRAEAKARAAK